MRDGGPGRTIRVVVVGAGALAAATLVLHPVLARDPTGSPASLLAARRANDANRVGDVFEPARDTLRRRPLDAEALGLIAIASLRTGQTAAGDAALGLGGAMGWRDSRVQALLAERAAQSGDMQNAAIRLIALYKRGKTPAAAIAALRRVAMMPGGAQTLGPLLVETGVDPVTLLATVDDLKPEQVEGHARIAAALAAVDPVSTGAAAQPFVGWLLANRQPLVARRLSARFGGPWRVPTETLLVDGSLSQVRNEELRDRLAWIAPTLPGTSLARDRSSGRPALAVTADGNAGGPVLSQTLTLAPGRYQVGLVARDWQTGPAAAMSWKLTCVGDGSELPVRFEGGQRGWKRYRAAVTVPTNAACATQRLTLDANALTVPTPQQAWVARIDLSRS